MGAMTIIRRVSGDLISVTPRDEAVRQAVERLSNDPRKLIAEIERDIQRQRGAEISIAARAGDYTPEVVAHVADLYRANGYSVEVHGYWMHLS